MNRNVLGYDMFNLCQPLYCLASLKNICHGVDDNPENLPCISYSLCLFTNLSTPLRWTQECTSQILLHVRACRLAARSVVSSQGQLSHLSGSVPVVKGSLTPSLSEGVVVAQSLSPVWLSVTPWTTARQAPLSFTISQSLLEFMSIESVMPSNHLILCCPLLLLPSIFPRIRVFSNELPFCIMWPKCWSFSSSISPSNEHSGLISFTIDWLGLLAVQGTLKSLLQHHNLKGFIFWYSVFFMVQFLHPYMMVRGWRGIKS